MSPRKKGPRKQAAKADSREQLQEYRRKRDFRRTAEPSGDAAHAAGGDRLQFVIQKHAASHLHYDLRLELDGVMRSWAVPKGPSLNPAVKRLAMQVEDHPMDYNTFEGTIPHGEYGGGTVMLWDRGTYTPDEPARGESAADAVRRGLRAGKLSFTFRGQRLHGSFALIRTERGARPKWLLMKHRDDDAQTGAEITAVVRTSVATGRTMEEIAEEADRVWRSNRGGRRGGEEKGSAAEEAAADRVIAPMKPTPAREIPAGDGWAFGVWHGGDRVLVYAAPDAARILDERARERTGHHRDIAEALQAFAARVGQAFVLDGEMVIEDDDRTVLVVADLLVTGDDVWLDAPADERRAGLEKLFHRRRVKDVRLQALFADPADAVTRAERVGAPGVLARRADAPYLPGRRSDGLLRIA